MSDTQFDDEILDSNAISPTDEEGNPVPVTIPIALAPGVTVVYTTRLGGVSHGDFGDCNLGGKGGDDLQAILANRVSLAKSVGCGLSLVSQVHSGRAVDVDASWHLNTPFGFDVSGTPGEVTADGEAQAATVVEADGQVTSRAGHVRCGLPAGADGRRPGRRDRRRSLRAQGPAARHHRRHD